MKTNIIQIGNSQGIRIPKIWIDQYHLDKVELIAQKGRLIIKALKRRPRKNWANQFEKMAKNKEDSLLISDSLELNSKDWEWK